MVTIGAAFLVLGVMAWGYARAAGPGRRARVTAVAAASVLAIPLAGALGGRLVVQSPAGEGTRLLAEIPAAFLCM